MTEWLLERSAEFRAGIEYVVIDPAAVYAAAVRTQGLLPNAVLVVDHFHLVAKANEAVTKVRQRVTWNQRARRGRRLDPEWANRRRLLRARERMSDSSFRKMFDEIDAQDPSGARTEGYNRLVKQVKRSACGFRNVENSARRIRFHTTRSARANIQTFC